MSVEGLRELSRVLGPAGDEGANLTLRRTRDLGTSQHNLTRVGQAWESPESEQLVALALAYLNRASSTGEGYGRGYRTMADVAQRAGTLATQLEEAQQREMSLWQRAQSLGSSLWNSAVDVVTERDLQAREQAQQEHRRAMSQHDEAKQERQRLEAEWRLACEEATRALQTALSNVQSYDVAVPGELEGRAFLPMYTRQDTRIAWSSYVGRVIMGADSAEEIRALWEGMDATERRVLIQTHPGLVHNYLRDVVDEDWDALFAEFHAYQVSGGALSLGGSAKVDIKVVTVGLGAGVQLDQATMSDGSVDVRLRLDAEASVGLDIKMIGGHLGRDGEVWTQLSFASVEEYEAFLADLRQAVADDRDPWRAGEGESIRDRSRRMVTSELVTVLYRTINENMAGVGGQQGAFGRVEASVPNVVSAAADLSVGEFHNTVSGHTGLYLSGSVKGAVYSGPGPGFSGSTTSSVEGRVYVDRDDRAYLNLSFDGQALGGVGVRGDMGTVNGSIDSLAMTGTDVNWTIEVRPETEPLIRDVLAALAPPADANAFASSLVELHDASEVTARSVSGSQHTAKMGGMTGPRGAEGSLSAGGSTSQTDVITHKAPYDQPYTISVAH